MSNQSETRTVTSLRNGTKIALMVAIPLLAIAVYYFVSPTSFMGKDGGVFGCGSPLNPNKSALGRGQCHIIEQGARDKALLFLALSLLTGALGAFFFGSDKSQQHANRSRLEDVDHGRKSNHADRGVERSAGRDAERDIRHGDRAERERHTDVRHTDARFDDVRDEYPDSRNRSEDVRSETSREPVRSTGDTEARSGGFLDRSGRGGSILAGRSERREKEAADSQARFTQDERPRFGDEDRPRLGDEDRPRLGDEDRPARVRSRFTDDEAPADRDAERHMPGRRRYDDDSFDSARD